MPFLGSGRNGGAEYPHPDWWAGDILKCMQVEGGGGTMIALNA